MSEARTSRGPNKGETPTYVARVCWNTAGWVQPTGDAAKAEANTYVAKNGFGHEEWLFNFAWVLDGWKYSFLQPVGRSLARLEGKTLDINLYAVSSEREWLYVGEVKKCQVIDEVTAAAARREFKSRGWLRMMGEHVRNVGGDTSALRRGSLFNIRFRTSDANVYPPNTTVGSKDAIRRLRRYTLVRVDNHPSRVLQDWRTRVGATELGATGQVLRRGSEARHVDLVHEQLKKELYERLVKRFGKRAVTTEGGFVDVRLDHRGRTTLYEVKSNPRQRFAIREALGQVLEYAYRATKAGDRVHELVIAAPGEPDRPERLYIDHLRKLRGLPLRYLCLRHGQPTDVV